MSLTSNSHFNAAVLLANSVPALAADAAAWPFETRAVLITLSDYGKSYGSSWDDIGISAQHQRIAAA